MEKGPDSELSTAPLFPSASLGVTGDEKIDLALKTTDFGDSLPKTDYSEGLQTVETRDSTQGEEMEEHPMLHNVVATINVGCRLDLKEIVSKARNVEYNPKRFAALIMRIRNPKTTALCFNSGKIVVTGAKTEANCRMAGRKFTRILQKLGYDAHFTEFKIQNLVATSKTNFPIRLEGLVLKHSNFAHYEPELFPGLIYRMIKPKVVLLIFVSGQIVFTGAQKYSDIETAFRNILPVLKEFKKDPAPKTL